MGRIAQYLIAHWKSPLRGLSPVAVFGLRAESTDTSREAEQHSRAAKAAQSSPKPLSLNRVVTDLGQIAATQTDHSVQVGQIPR
jgi:hypothetical protein